MHYLYKIDELQLYQLKQEKFCFEKISLRNSLFGYYSLLLKLINRLLLYLTEIKEGMRNQIISGSE